MILRNRSESVILQTLEFLPPVSLELEYHLHPSFCLCLLVSGRKLSNAFPPTMPVAAAKSLQSCPTLCDPIDGSPPGSPIPGILQARTLEWVAISFSNAWNWEVKVKSLSRVRPSATPWTAAYQAPPSIGFSRQEHWSGVPVPSLPTMPSTVPCLYVYDQSCATLCNPMNRSLPDFSCPWNFPRKNTGMGWHFWLQRNFLTQGSNTHLR